MLIKNLKEERMKDRRKKVGKEKTKMEEKKIRNDGLVWFVGFYGISTFVGYLTPNAFLCK